MKKYGTTIIIVLLIVICIGIALFVFIKKKEEKEALGENFLGTDNPRNIRNNNPGNIILTVKTWEGEIPRIQNTDGKFKQFRSFADGTMQMIDLLITYNGTNRNTVKKIIDSWDYEGNESYISFVENYTGFNRNTVLTPNKETLRKLSKAITSFEAGEDFLTDARFEAGWKLLNPTA